MRTLENGKLTIGVDASASAGPVGTGRGQASPVPGAEVLTYSRSSGLFAGATLNGSGVEVDNEGMVGLYGSSVSTRAVLAGEVEAPKEPAVHSFRTALREAFPATPPVAQSSR